MSEATFTFRVDEALKSEFSNAAKSRVPPQVLPGLYERAVCHGSQAENRGLTWCNGCTSIGLCRS